MSRKPKTITRSAIDEARDELFRTTRDLDGSSHRAYCQVVALDHYLDLRDRVRMGEEIPDVVVPNPDHPENVEMWREFETMAEARSNAEDDDAPEDAEFIEDEA